MGETRPKAWGPVPTPSSGANHGLRATALFWGRASSSRCAKSPQRQRQRPELALPSPQKQRWLRCDRDSPGVRVSPATRERHLQHLQLSSRVRLRAPRNQPKDRPATPCFPAAPVPSCGTYPRSRSAWGPPHPAPTVSQWLPPPPLGDIFPLLTHLLKLFNSNAFNGSVAFALGVRWGQRDKAQSASGAQSAWGALALARCDPTQRCTCPRPRPPHPASGEWARAVPDCRQARERVRPHLAPGDARQTSLTEILEAPALSDAFCVPAPLASGNPLKRGAVNTPLPGTTAPRHG